MVWNQFKDVASQKLNQSGLYQHVQKSLAVEEANKLILEFWGDKTKNKVQALYLKNDILTIAVLADNLVPELEKGKEEFIKRLNTKLENKVVENLRFLI